MINQRNNRFVIIFANALLNNIACISNMWVEYELYFDDTECGPKCALVFIW